MCAGHVYGLEPDKALTRTVGVFFVEPTCFASVGAADYFDFLAVSEVGHFVLLHCSFRCAQYRHASKWSQGLFAHSLREENCAIILALHNRLKRIPDGVDVVVPVINDNRENVAG